MNWIRDLVEQAPAHLSPEDEARARRGLKPLAWQSAGGARELPDIVVQTLRDRGQSVPVINNRGRIIGWSVPGTDVSDIRRREAQENYRRERYGVWYVPR